ncbi:MAG: hypothetical protein ACREPM_14190 [Gemmatimonadaceae bacterium]
MSARRIVATLVCFTTSSLAAQMPDMPGMAGMHHEATTAVSAVARREIDSVVKAVVPLGLPGAASAAGFRPAFGWIPTMGEHWVSRAMMVNGRQTNRSAPSQLMFSKIDGRDSLVGAAYGYLTTVGDTVRPELFDGAPPWHEHRDLAPAGMTLVMLHVWFVPSPDGPFAGTNPNLPFWAVGLNAPDAARMHDAAFESRVYRASLALAEVADTTSILANLERRPEVKAAINARRDTVRALIPELLAAQNAKDNARWDRAADKTAKQWDAMQETYLASARTADGKERIDRFISMLLGHHGG